MGPRCGGFANQSPRKTRRAIAPRAQHLSRSPKLRPCAARDGRPRVKREAVFRRVRGEKRAGASILSGSIREPMAMATDPIQAIGHLSVTTTSRRITGRPHLGDVPCVMPSRARRPGLGRFGRICHVAEILPGPQHDARCRSCSPRSSSPTSAPLPDAEPPPHEQGPGIHEGGTAHPDEHPRSRTSPASFMQSSGAEDDQRHAMTMPRMVSVVRSCRRPRFRRMLMTRSRRAPGGPSSNGCLGSGDARGPSDSAGTHPGSAAPCRRPSR